MLVMHWLSTMLFILYIVSIRIVLWNMECGLAARASLVLGLEHCRLLTVWMDVFLRCYCLMQAIWHGYMSPYEFNKHPYNHLNNS